MRAAIKGHRHVKAILRRMAKSGPCDLVVGVGDYTQTGEGKEAQEAMDLLDRTFGRTKKILIPGNHDTRSLLWLTDKWALNFSEARLRDYERIYKTSLFGATELENNVLLVWLLSEPFIFDWHRHNYLPAETVSLLMGLHQAQLDFLAETFREHPHRQILLAVHDPSVFLSTDLRKALEPIRSRLMLTITGHVHARWLMNLMCVRHPILWPQLLWHMYRFKAQLIPSIWGITLPWTLWMAGAGWSDLHIDNNGQYELVPHYVNKKTSTTEDPG